MRQTQGEAYPTSASIIQHNPSVHPTVVSPLKAFQLNIKSIPKLFPATSDVNKINTVAVR
jgi:hypothetical protein